MTMDWAMRGPRRARRLPISRRSGKRIQFCCLDTTTSMTVRGGTLKGSTIRITPPSDTRGSDRRARPFVRPAFGESPGPAVFGYRRARPSAVPDVVSPPRSAQRTPGALARGADDRRSGRGRGTLGARSSQTRRIRKLDHAALMYSCTSPPRRSRRSMSGTRSASSTGARRSGT
jgi:hypothetical protein